MDMRTYLASKLPERDFDPTLMGEAGMVDAKAGGVIDQIRLALAELVNFRAHVNGDGEVEIDHMTPALVEFTGFNDIAMAPSVVATVYGGYCTGDHKGSCGVSCKDWGETLKFQAVAKKKTANSVLVEYAPVMPGRSL